MYGNSFSLQCHRWSLHFHLRVVGIGNLGGSVGLFGSRWGVAMHAATVGIVASAHNCKSFVLFSLAVGYGSILQFACGCAIVSAAHAPSPYRSSRVPTCQFMLGPIALANARVGVDVVISVFGVVPCCPGSLHIACRWWPDSQ